MPDLPIAEQISPKLYTACEQDNVPQVQALTSNNSSPSFWHGVLLAAVIEKSTDVAAYCLAQGVTVDDFILRNVVGSNKSEPVYRYFVQNKAVDVNRYVDRGGAVLGIATTSGRYSLVRFCLENGASPNEPIEMSGNLTPLACAARQYDEEMVRLLLDHGAQMKDSGALVFAAQEGKLATVKLLIARGADVNEKRIQRRGRKKMETRKSTHMHCVGHAHCTHGAGFV